MPSRLRDAIASVRADKHKAAAPYPGLCPPLQLWEVEARVSPDNCWRRGARVRCRPVGRLTDTGSLSQDIPRAGGSTLPLSSMYGRIGRKSPMITVSGTTTSSGTSILL
jgi:hypothetical protein